jgi:hypothetical protein
MKQIFIVLLLANVTFFVWLNWGGSEKPPTPVSAVPHNVGNLQTLSERSLKNKEKKIAPKKIEEEAVVAEAERCQMIGPYAEVLHAEYLAEKLKALDVSASIENVTITDGKVYWVYLMPEMSDKEALRRLHEIQAKPIADAYIIPSGELANGISLGQFTDEGEAQARKLAIAQHGYSVFIKELPKSHSETWVQILYMDAQKIDEATWLELLNEEKEIERRKNYCLGVAKN